MKFADRSPSERTAIDAWIRVSLMVREDGCMKVSDSFKQEREKNISELPGDIAKMLRFYAAYQGSGQSVSYTQYFQVSEPAEYAAMVLDEKKLP
jgi:hypothetical protein